MSRIEVKLVLLVMLIVIINSCGNKKSRKKIAFTICDSIHYFEQPRWWDNINVLIDDSIINVSKSPYDYLQLCRKHRTKKLYEDTFYKESYNQFRKYPLKAKYLFHTIKENMNSDVLHYFSDEVSHELSININKELFLCDKNYHTISTAENIAEDYLAICNYEKAKEYYKIALKLNQEEKDLEKDLSKLKNYDYRKENITKKINNTIEKEKGKLSQLDIANCGFNDKINFFLEKINDFKTPKRKEQIKAFIENRKVKEIFSDVLDEKTDNFYDDKTDYELALCNILYEDGKSDTPLIINPETMIRVKEYFRDYNMLDHMNFEVGIGNVAVLNEDRNEWLISFWSGIEDSHGITVIYLKGYKITDIHNVD